MNLSFIWSRAPCISLRGNASQIGSWVKRSKAEHRVTKKGLEI
jgi:hypothetical protein